MLLGLLSSSAVNERPLGETGSVLLFWALPFLSCLFASLMSWERSLLRSEEVMSVLVASVWKIVLMKLSRAFFGTGLTEAFF